MKPDLSKDLDDLLALAIKTVGAVVSLSKSVRTLKSLKEQIDAGHWASVPDAIETYSIACRALIIDQRAEFENLANQWVQWVPVQRVFSLDPYRHVPAAFDSWVQFSSGPVEEISNRAASGIEAAWLLLFLTIGGFWQFDQRVPAEDESDVQRGAYIAHLLKVHLPDFDDFAGQRLTTRLRLEFSRRAAAELTSPGPVRWPSVPVPEQIAIDQKHLAVLRYLDRVKIFVKQEDLAQRGARFGFPKTRGPVGKILDYLVRLGMVERAPKGQSGCKITASGHAYCESRKRK